AYTWKTRAYLGGKLANGVLAGDLILSGGGDPYMTSERWWSFVQELRSLGVAKISGDVVIDNSYFAPMEATRADFDAQPWRSYNVLPDALLVNFQTSRFTLSTAAQRGRPLIVVTPRPANLVLKNQVQLKPGTCQAQEPIEFEAPADGSRTLVVTG